MSFWKALFHKEEGWQLDHVIATTMSIDPCAIIEVLLIANHYQESDQKQEAIQVNDSIIECLTESNGFWYNNFDFFYDNRNGLIQNRCPDKISSEVYENLREKMHAVNPDDGTVFHPKIFLVRWRNKNEYCWTAMVSSHNLTLSKPYECAAVLESKEGDCNHDFADLLSFLTEKAPSCEKLFAEYQKELKKLNFQLIESSNEVKVEEIRISGVKKNALRPHADIYSSLNPKNWRVVSPNYETGPNFRRNGLIFHPMDKGKAIDTHAKMYFWDEQGNGNFTHMWLGSANCSDRGLGGNNSNVNVECLVHLTSNNGFLSVTNEGFTFGNVTFKETNSFPEYTDSENPFYTLISNYNLTIKNYYLEESNLDLKPKLNSSVTIVPKKAAAGSSCTFDILPVGFPDTQNFGKDSKWEELKIPFPPASEKNYEYNKANKTTYFETTFKGGRDTEPANALRVCYQQREYLWYADEIVDNLMRDEQKRYQDYYYALSNFRISAYKDELMQKNFCYKWKTVAKYYSDNIERANQLDVILRNYLDVMSLCGKKIDPAGFIWKDEQQYTTYQQDAIDKAFEQLTKQQDGCAPRYLVADEAGLGKTHIARGIIEKFAEQNPNKVTSVVYFASNLYLLGKTADKLIPDKTWTYDNTIDRISMVPTTNTNTQGNGILLYMVSGNTMDSEGTDEERLYLCSNYQLDRNYLNPNYGTKDQRKTAIQIARNLGTR